MAREPLPAMVRTRPLDPSKAAIINLSKTVKITRPATASTADGESNEVLGLPFVSSGHNHINQPPH